MREKIHFSNLKKMFGQKTKEGFFDLPKITVCKDPEHYPPSHMVVPQGKGYKHVCPSCKNVSVIIPPQISL
jgi:hypothetical protein